MARLSLVLPVLALAAIPATASADVFKLYAEARGGGMYGSGLAGDQKDAAFAQRSRGLGYGALVGGQFLIFDGHVKHTQYRHSGELTTWTQFNAGLNFALDMGTEQQKKAFKGSYFQMGAALGFGVGTGAQIDPPLDNSEVTDKGFFVEGRIGFGKHLNKVFDLGVEVPVSWAYLFKSGAANDESNQYQQIQIDALLVLRANLRFL